MNKQFIIALAIVHWVLTAVGFMLVYGGAIAAQDAGTAAAALAWLEWPLRFGLLQPLAHWVLAGFPIAWWTWPGLVVLMALFALNSVITAGIIASLVTAWRAWRRQGTAGKI